MLERVFAVLAPTVLSATGTFAHTTDALHPHPHSMDLTSGQGAAVVALLLAAFGLVVVARHLATAGRQSIKNNRSSQ